jgi:hypothetical protein
MYVAIHRLWAFSGRHRGRTKRKSMQPDTFLMFCIRKYLAARQHANVHAASLLQTNHQATGGRNVM